MQKILGIFLGTAMLLQLLGTTLIVADFELRRAEITEMFCINKAKPELKCNGQCHLMKRVAEQSEQESNAAIANVEPMHPAILNTSGVALVFAAQNAVLHNDYYTNGLLSGRSLAVFHPPQV